MTKRNELGLTKTEMKKFNKKKNWVEQCRKCGNHYLFDIELEGKELCGYDLCYDCVCLRHLGPMLMLAVMTVGGYNADALFNECTECGGKYYKFGEKYDAYDTGRHCPNCAVKNFLTNKK